MTTTRKTELLFWLLVAMVCLGLYFVIGQFLKFSEARSPLVFELFAAIMGSIVTVSAMALMMRIQSQQETHKEFAARLFDRKLAIYQDLIETLFSNDDDQVLTREEVQAIENKIGLACLVANAELVSTFAQFLIQQKTYGALYFRNLEPEQLQHFCQFVEREKNKTQQQSELANQKHQLAQAPQGHELDYFITLDNVIQGMRDDLAVVEGNVQQEIEHFIRTPHNPQAARAD